MLENVQAPSHVAAFRLEREVTRADLNRAIAEIEARLRAHSRIAVYIDLERATHLTLEAWIADLSQRFAMRKLLDRIGRVAVVADQSWLRALTAVARPTLPFELQTFHASAREEALTWTSAFDPDALRPPGLRLIATTRPDTYAFVWNGKITRSELDRVVRVLEDELETHISARFLGRLERMGGIEPRALLNRALLHAKLMGARKVERYALVGDARWLDVYCRWVRWISGIETRAFPLSREAEAWKWLEAQPSAQAERAAANASATHVNA